MLAILHCIAVYAALALGRRAVGEIHSPSSDQVPLVPVSHHTSSRTLRGKFLHITDLHPDPFYVSGSNPDEACHHSHGFAGPLGAETTQCDSPIPLLNATFTWLKQNLQDEVDFVIWTGDSARHDNDERIPRNRTQILSQNTFVLEKFREVWGKEGNGQGELDGEFKIPIVPTFGNNDILPHNIMLKGPNEWTKTYLQLWKRLVPEEQRHSFERGGWYYVEVIPGKLAVFSLNTMYLFGNNAAVDGCDDTNEPGYEQFEWLRVQLQLLRQRGVKAILTGHVPPARNEQKEMWTDSCWMKYALWVKQYRDVVVGSIWGHMNVEHFFLQDFTDIIWDTDTKDLLEDVDENEELADELSSELRRREEADISIKVSPPNYLNALREQWSSLPDEPDTASSPDASRKKKKKGKTSPQDRYHKAIGGEHAERYAVSFVSPSVVPNYFPSLRVFEYNISGLENHDRAPAGYAPSSVDFTVPPSGEPALEGETEELCDHSGNCVFVDKKKKHKKHKKGKGKKQKPHFTVPDSPKEADLPGPAYVPQQLSWLGYKQYYANLTRIQRRDEDRENNDFEHWRDQGLRPFNFEIEYDTRAEGDVYRLNDDRGGITVRNMLSVASKIGDFKPKKSGWNFGDPTGEDTNDAEREEPSSAGKSSDVDGSMNEHDANTDGNAIESTRKKKKRERKKKRRALINKTWFAFVDRALVGTVPQEDLKREYG